MTRHRQVVVRCPQCDIKYSSDVIASINTAEWKQFSDGYGVGRLYELRCRACRCACGAFFFDDKHVVRFKVYVPPDFAFMRKAMRAQRARSWIGRLFHRNQSPIASPENPAPPETGEDFSRVLRVNAESIKSALIDIEGLTSLDAAVEYEIRRWGFWCYHHRTPVDDARQTEASHRNNTKRLVDLIVALGKSDILLQGQALRELGRFDEAMIVYCNIPDFDPDKATLISLVRKLSSEVVQLA